MLIYISLLWNRGSPLKETSHENLTKSLSLLRIAADPRTYLSLFPSPSSSPTQLPFFPLSINEKHSFPYTTRKLFSKNEWRADDALTSDQSDRFVFPINSLIEYKWRKEKNHFLTTLSVQWFFSWPIGWVKRLPFYRISDDWTSTLKQPSLFLQKNNIILFVL